MSLVIIKVDREKKTHSIYCDGRCGNMVMQKANKISEYKTQGHSILVGTAGYRNFNTYFRLHFVEIVVRERLLDYLDDNEVATAKLIDIGMIIWRDFCAKIGLPKKKNSYDAFGAILSIDGKLYELDGFIVDERFVFESHEIDRDFAVSGSEDTAALCLLEAGVDIKTIFKVISKYNYYVNNNITSIEDVMF